MKRKMAFINGSGTGSTGRICFFLANYGNRLGWETRCFFSSAFPPNQSEHHPSYELIPEHGVTRFVNRVLCRLDGSDGFHNVAATEKLLSQLKSFEPDLVHIHNIHGHFINLELLVDYLVEKRIPVVWTLHDCWPFTGRCAYFDAVGCNQWKTGCRNCPKASRREYPASYLINLPAKNQKKKMDAIMKLEGHVTFVSPSRWLQGLFVESPLGKFPCLWIPNGITEKDFVPGERKGKITLFSAAYPFSPLKGFAEIIELSKSLDYSRFDLVVAGLDARQAALLDSRAQSAGVIKNPKRMNRLFADSDYFLNPTHQDNFPTVNLESLAAGTPVITYDSGGAAEMLTPETGYIVPSGDYDSLLRLVLSLRKTKQVTRNACLDQASHFTAETMGERYYELYASMLSRNRN